MPKNNRLAKIGLLGGLIAGITLGHYAFGPERGFLHVALREVYFLPLILAAFWFGLKGGLASSLTVTVLYLPFVMFHGDDFSPHMLGNWLELSLFNMVAGLLGWLRDRDWTRQQELNRAQFLASMGSATAALAHDMKTPLIAIGGLVNQVRRKMAETDTGGPKLDIALSQVARLEAMVRDMLTFSRDLEIEPEPGDVNRLVQETLLVALPLAEKRRVELRFDVTQGVPVVSCDYQRLQQALLNLVNNAVEASPEEEVVTVRSLLGKEAVILEVADRGPGIAKEKREEIFTPFVTTKKEGTGLGLPIVRKIAEAHGITVSVDENPGGGALFRLVIPLNPP